MCGYIGVVSKKELDRETLRNANKPIVCRGPDNTSEMFTTNKELFNNQRIDLHISGIFNRLSILELSDLGNQPMVFSEGRTMIMFNGEIFNYKELKKNLISDGLKFNSQNSDTEVLLKGLTHYGIGFVNKLIGQFSIAYFDGSNNNIFLIRDRVGQKPLFYSVDNNRIIFSSNLTSIYNLKKDSVVSDSQIINYLNFGVIPSPNTIFDNVYKVKPGSIIKINLKDFSYTESTYWDTRNYIDNKNFDEGTFYDLMSKSINYRLVSDVPIANFLSGGLDSTTIIKNLYDNNIRNINTFTVAVNDKKYDESKWAKIVAEKYRTNHTIEMIDSKLNHEIILESLKAFDEIYADPSTILTYQISKVISTNYKVAISGDGGDELLGGYLRTKMMFERNNLPKDAIKIINSIYPSHYGTAQRFLYKQKDTSRAYSSFFEDINLLNLLKLERNIQFEESYYEDFGDKYKNIITSDYKFYLPEMMMLKVDRASMANSLEVRSPFVDNKLIEYILSTKSNFMDIGQKYLFKNYLKEDFDSNFLNRKKQGFVFDLENWVFANLNLIFETVKKGKIVGGLNKDIISILSKRKTRVNALRIWKIFVLERYLEDLTEK
jgi:asparagine synthase (glutamine-hydrolysing)